MPAAPPREPDRQPGTRWVAVSGERLAGWVERFGASHGGAELDDSDAGLRLVAHDGTTALLQPPWPVDGRPGRGPDGVTRLASLASQPRRTGLLLIRRGGYGVAVTGAGQVLASKVGGKSSRSRGRGDGSDSMLADAVEQARAVFARENFEYLAPGGDRLLADAALARPALAKYAGYPRLAYLDVPDPRADVLKRAAQDVCAVRIQVTDAQSRRD